MKFHFKPNLNKLQIQCLFKFIKEKPFKILDTDKNVGSAIISNDLYDQLAFNHLNDKSIYSEIEVNPLQPTISKINFSLNQLVKNSHISIKLFDLLVVSEHEC